MLTGKEGCDNMLHTYIYNTHRVFVSKTTRHLIVKVTITAYL